MDTDKSVQQSVQEIVQVHTDSKGLGMEVRVAILEEVVASSLIS